MAASHQGHFGLCRYKSAQAPLDTLNFPPFSSKIALLKAPLNFAFRRLLLLGLQIYREARDQLKTQAYLAPKLPLEALSLACFYPRQNCHLCPLYQLASYKCAEGFITAVHIADEVNLVVHFAKIYTLPTIVFIKKTI